MEVFINYGADKWLSDDRLNSAVPTADLEWSVNDWMPRAIAAGWRYWAIIMPDKVAGQWTMNRILTNHEDVRAEVRVFDSVDDALHWLGTVDDTDAVDFADITPSNGV